MVNRSIAGVKVGDTIALVRNELGPPSRLIQGRNDFGPYSQLLYTPLKLEVFSQGRRVVTHVTTKNREERTAGGLGVGSTYSAVRAAFRTEHCESAGPGQRLCNIGALRVGRKVTTFRFTNLRVVSVSVGTVLD